MSSGDHKTLRVPWRRSRPSGAIVCGGMFGPSTQATFVPADPPRLSALALWDETRSTGDGTLELALRAGSTVRRRQVPVTLVPMSKALDALIELPPGDDLCDSVRAWSAAAGFAVDAIARGRVVPARSPDGFDSWSIAPLDPSDAENRRLLADALPAAAHALVVRSQPRVEVWDPLAAVDAFFDAVADTLPRTATGPTISRTHGGVDPAEVAAGWLDSLTGSGSSVGLRLELPADGQMSATLTVQSLSDPSLVVDATTLWNSPDVVLARFESDVDTDLLLTLRRGSRVWEPLGRLLDEAVPERLELSDGEAEDLLGPIADDLASAGISVMWPHDVFAALELRPVITTRAPAGATGAGLTLDSIAEMGWTGVLDGAELTAEELALIAEAKRPFVRVRGRWVRADPDRLARLRERRRLGVGSALAAALGGTTFVDGEPEDVEVVGPIADLAERLRDATEDRELSEPAGLDATLRPYQRRGLAWLSEMTELGLGGVLADDMGLGKTLQVLALHISRGAGTTLVVCPASVIGNWEREAARFVPAIPVIRYHGSNRSLDALPAGGLVVTTYGTLRRDAERLGEVGWDLVVADEAQAIKNPFARVSKAARSVPATARIALTGTPVENHLGDLWAILDWTTPGLLGPFETFRREVALPIERHHDAGVTEMFGRLVRPFLLRRRKSDPGVAPDLPPKIETDELMPLTVEQATLYRAAVADALEEIEEADGMNRRGLVLKLLTGLKQICNHPAQFLGQTSPLTRRSGKLDGLVELVDVITDEGDATLVFTQFVAMGRLIESHLSSRGTRTRFLHGSVSVKRRMEMVDEFQEGDVDVFVISLKAGGTGVNLTRASHVIHYDRWWNPAVEDQASDRAWRIGQDRTVQVHRFVCEGTVEDRIAGLLAEKRALADAVVGTGEGWITEMSDDDLAALVSLGSAD